MFREIKDTLYRTMSLSLFRTFYGWTAEQQKHTFGIDFIAVTTDISQDVSW